MVYWLAHALAQPVLQQAYCITVFKPCQNLTAALSVGYVTSPPCILPGPRAIFVENTLCTGVIGSACTIAPTGTGIAQLSPQDGTQGCGSATSFRDCSSKRKYKNPALTWSRVGPSLPPVYNTCFTDYIIFTYRSTLLIRIWILAFCLCNALFFLLYVEPNLPLTLVVALRSSLPGNGLA